VVGIAFVVVVGILFAFRSTTFVQRILAVGRAVNTSWTDFKSSPRYIAWQIAIKAWKEKPVFGWGPNNYYFAFNKYYDPRSLNFGYGETWFDNAHNIIVNTMAVQGTVGIIAYLGIFGTTFFCLVRAYRRQLIDRHIFIIGGAFLVAHLVQNVTVFENITSYLYFFFWLAFLNRLSTVVQPVSVREDRKLGGGSYAFAGVVVVLGIVIFNIQPARANRATLRTLRSIQTSPEVAVEDVKQTLAIDYSPHVDDIRTDVTRTITGILTSQNNPDLQPSMRLKDETRTAYFDIAYSTLQKNIVLHPLDIRLHFMLTELLQNQALATRNLTIMQEAEGIMTHALSMSQDRQQLIFSLSIIKLYLGKNQEALDLLARARTSNPMIGETYWRIAYIQRVMGDFEASKKTIAEGEAAGARFNPEDQRIVSQLLIPPPSTTSTTPTPVKKKK
jgi:tetratricopeptide (TPR) repeat protein